jgi:putative ABC transport system permease protein
MMLNELRQAWRSLRARRGLAATVVLSLAAGIGANALLFAVVDGAVLRPFTFPDPRRLVGVGAAYPKLRAPLDFFEVLSGPEYQEIKQGAHLDDVAGFDLGNEPVMIGTTPERIFTAYLWDDLFATLRMQPALGRPLSRAEINSAAPVAIVSHAFWQNHLAASRSVIGSTISVGGRPHQIVGVMPPRTRIYGTDLWIPMQERAEALPRTRRQFNVLARLPPGESIDQANASLDVVARRLEASFGASVPEYQAFSLEAKSWTDIEVWGGADVTAVVFAGLGLLLLLGTANVANLLLARASTRSGEMALRVALGASPGTLAREAMFESMLQAAAGAGLGLTLAAIGIRMLPAWLPGFLPDDVSLALGGRVLLFAALLATAATLLVGLLPALQHTRAHPASLLSAGTLRATRTRGARRCQSAIVALEVAIAVIVSGGAALLLVQTRQILSVDPGFDPQRLVMMRLTLPLPKYAGSASMAFFDRILEEARALPSIEQASVSNQPPPGLFSRSQFRVDGRHGDGESLPSAFFTTAGPAYRETIGLRLTRGRWFDERVDRNGPREVVINDAATRRFFSGEDPIGRRIQIIGPAFENAWAEIVGIVADVRNRGLAFNPQPEIIASVRQIPERRQSQLYVVARARHDAETAVRNVRRIISTLDAQQPIYAVTTVQEQMEGGVAPRRLAARVLVAFSALALAIAGLGIYGVLSHAVGQRTREIGVRLALGARALQVRRMVVLQAMVPVALGIAAGLLALVFGSQLMASWVFGVEPSVGVLAVVVALLAAVGLCASALPAWRASRLNPVVALRTD